MTTVIIEDEQLIAEELETMIRTIEPEIKFLATLSSIKQAKKWFEANPLPDLLFMDIQLSDGVSFELFNSFKIDCPVIFTTAYNEYAIRAFKVNSIDYLVKPIDRKDLEFAFNKFKSIKKQDLNVELASLIKSLSANNQPKVYKQRFAVHIKNTLVPIETSDIAYIFREEIIYIVNFENQKFVLDYHSIEEIEELLDPAEFFRANRQCIIHINSVENYKGDYSGKLYVKLKSPINQSIDISREKASVFKKWILLE
jgi:DNA-binding LytR/AlgR family response regulator